MVTSHLQSVTTLGQYQFILLVQQRQMWKRLLQGHCMTSERLDIELVSYGLPVLCLLLFHYAMPKHDRCAVSAFIINV